MKRVAIALAVASAAGLALTRRLRQARSEAALWQEATREPDLR